MVFELCHDDSVDEKLQRRLLRLREAAEYLGIGESTLRSWLRDGRIAHVKMGHTVRVDRVDLDQYIERSRTRVPMW